ncbi:outer membrane protein [Croceibacterium aestuarii]|uniref:outer membrane protein n=1 Tax=Croceibacterium aestuarii TaxID=3064139 RepID=UPI00272E70CE|nr:outer membrane beta-barrel protein [Croceibacterium sp. D39]
MKKGLALILATAATATAVPAMAQDAGFSGPWIAGVAGYDINKPGSSQVSAVDPDQDVNAEGAVYGAAVGYDFDMGNLVVGAEGELTDSTADSTYGNPYTTFGLGSVDAGRDLYAGARVGYKMSPTTMLYAKGGYTNARFNYIGTDGTTEYSRHLDTDGYRLGAGVEHKFGSMAFGKLEYRYSNYKKGEVDFEASGVADSDRFDIDTDRHQVVASVGVRF